MNYLKNNGYHIRRAEAHAPASHKGYNGNHGPNKRVNDINMGR